MHKKLTEIINKTKSDLLKRKKEKPLTVSGKVISEKRFYQSLLNPNFGKLAVIAEIKLASPNENDLDNEDDLENRAKQYEKAGVDAISVVTEKHFFKGDPKFINKIKQSVKQPILQKDFIIDPYQLYESKEDGADAILLIAKILTKKDLINLVNLSIRLGLEPVVEINNQKDLQKAITTKTKIIAVNARNLDTFKIDVDKACDLIKKIPSKFLKLGFSGIKGKKEMEKYKNAGAEGVLIGTSLMRAENIKDYILSLRGVRQLADDVAISTNKKIKVKICGIRTLDAALVAVNGEADFLGFNFVPTSKRYISPSKALKIINKVRGKVKIVGVFQNADIGKVKKIACDLNLDFAQLHGNESNHYINNVGIPVIKSVAVDDELSKNRAKYFLLDRIERGKGQMINLNKASKLAHEFRIFFAGGLNPENVTKVIDKVQPFAVDVAGGIEKNGVQDIEKIKKFIKNAKGVTL